MATLLGVQLYVFILSHIRFSVFCRYWRDSFPTNPIAGTRWFSYRFSTRSGCRLRSLVHRYRTCGSLITPAGRAGVYTLKLTPGIVNTEGICKLTIEWDTIGGFTKPVEEVAILSDLLLKTKEQETGEI